MVFPHTITVFNRTSEEYDDEVYEKALVDNVLFIQDENTARNKLGLTNADTVTVYIPRGSSESSGKQLVSPATYENLVDKSSSYCYRKGDFVCLGDISLDGVSINELKNTTGNVFEITGIADYRFGGLPNLVLSAR